MGRGGDFFKMEQILRIEIIFPALKISSDFLFSTMLRFLTDLNLENRSDFFRVSVNYFVLRTTLKEF